MMTIMRMIRGKIRSMNSYNRAVKELGRLTDRELSDIGLHRCDIERAARGDLKTA